MTHDGRFDQQQRPAMDVRPDLAERDGDIFARLEIGEPVQAGREDGAGEQKPSDDAQNDHGPRRPFPGICRDILATSPARGECGRTAWIAPRLAV